MNYAKIKKYDIYDFLTSVAALNCKNCFNPETWDFEYGEPFTKKVEDEIIEAMKPDYIKGFTLLGGDPFEPENAQALAPFIERLRKIYPDKSFWCFTGYDYESDILTGKKCEIEIALKILHCLDVLVDGRFIEEKKDLNLLFRGSSNQRIILVKPSLEKDEIVLWDEQSAV